MESSGGAGARQVDVTEVDVTEIDGNMQSPALNSTAAKFLGCETKERRTRRPPRLNSLKMTSRDNGSRTVSGQSIRLQWSDAIEAVIDGNYRKILVIGPADAGKSTFCLMLVEAMQSAGRDARLLDTDVGQKLVGPPACVTVGRSSPESVVCSQICFVGATSPVAGWKRLIACLAGMMEGSGDRVSIVNTSGLLAGPGQRLKDQKIGVVKPDLIIAIGEDRHLESIVARHAEFPVHRLASAPERRRKTSAERAAARRTAFRSYFRGSRSWIMAPSTLQWEPGSPDSPPPRRLLVGISDAAGRDLALAIVVDTDPMTGALTLFSPKRPRTGQRLKWGRMRLDDDFLESDFKP